LDALPTTLGLDFLSPSFPKVCAKSRACFAVLLDDVVCKTGIAIAAKGAVHGGIQTSSGSHPDLALHFCGVLLGVQTLGLPHGSGGKSRKPGLVHNHLQSGPPKNLPRNETVRVFCLAFLSEVQGLQTIRQACLALPAWRPEVASPNHTGSSDQLRVIHGMPLGRG
jgi:hypothetical protein